MMKFTRTHEWLMPEGTDMTMGITDHAQQLLGDLVFIELPEIGRQVNAGDEIGVVESVKAASDFYAPISGTIVAINEAVQRDAALVNHSPEQSGWLVRINASDPNEIAELLNQEEYEHHILESH
jgi:glycine cleavage system H protein